MADNAGEAGDDQRKPPGSGTPTTPAANMASAPATTSPAADATNPTTDTSNLTHAIPSNANLASSPPASSTSANIAASNPTQSTTTPIPNAPIASGSLGSPILTPTTSSSTSNAHFRSSGAGSAIPAQIPPQNLIFSAEPQVGYTGDMRAYCKSLENWLVNAYWQRECAVSAYFTALSSFRSHGQPQSQPQPQPQQRQNQTPLNNGIRFQAQAQPNAVPMANAGQAFNNNNQGTPNLNNSTDSNQTTPPGGGSRRAVHLRGLRRTRTGISFDFAPAPLWKRVFAECIDFFILLVVKVFVTLSIVDNFDLIDFDNIDLDALQESGNLMEVAYSLTSELLILELTHRVVVCFFEAYCIYKSGSTPGKSLLGLRVLHCDSVVPVVVRTRSGPGGQETVEGADGSRILVGPGTPLTFTRSLVRSIIKNFSLALFFPICLTVFHFGHKRTLYDVLSKSIVVELRP